MTPDLVSAVALPGAAAGTIGASGAAATPAVQLGWGASLTDFGAFERAMTGALQRIEGKRAEPPSAVAQALFRPLEHLNGEAARLSSDAGAAAAAGRELTPGEMVNLTVRCQEFMFHCQLTANIANRTSDGLQQLFRQQS
jgi:hypothetical protein